MPVLVTGGAGYIGSHMVLLHRPGKARREVVEDNDLPSSLEVCGTDYPTRDGSCLRDYIQVTDMARAHLAALRHRRAGGGGLTLNCGSGRGFSVLDVVETVKRVSGVDFKVTRSPRRRRSDGGRRECGPHPRHARLAAQT